MQTALLIWDPNALPVHGPDGKYGGETADAVFRFKAVELGVPEDEIVKDVDPRTVIRLDEIAAVDEARQASGFAVIAASNATTDDLVNIRQVIEDTGGAIVLGLGNLAAVTTGGSETLDAVLQLVGNTVAGVVFPTFPELPVDIDEETATLVNSWLAMFDETYLLQQLNPDRFGKSFDVLDGCMEGIDA